MDKAHITSPLLKSSEKGMPIGRLDTGFIRTNQVINRPPSNQHVWFSEFELRHPDAFVYYYSVSFVLIMGIHGCLTKLSSALPAIELLSLRSVFILVFLIVYRQRVDPNIQFNDKKFGKTLLLFSLLNVVTNYCYLSGIAKLSLTEGLSIMLTYPVLLPIISRVLFGDTLQTYQIVCFVMTCVGVLFIWRPPSVFGEETNTTMDVSFGVLLCSLQAVVSAGTVMMKKQRAPSLQSTTIFSQGVIASVVISIPLNVFYGWETPTPVTFAQIVLLAVVFFAAHIINTRIITETSKQLYYVNVIRYAQLVVALAFDYFVLNDLPNLMSCAGILLLILSGFYHSKGK